VCALASYRDDMRGSLAQAAWALRRDLTFYDALYVVLAAAQGRPLLTADGRLARTSGGSPGERGC
jgi:predicted nucleic acid-binding protein